MGFYLDEKQPKSFGHLRTHKNQAWLIDWLFNPFEAKFRFLYWIMYRKSRFKISHPRFSLLTEFHWCFMDTSRACVLHCYKKQDLMCVSFVAAFFVRYSYRLSSCCFLCGSSRWHLCMTVPRHHTLAGRPFHGSTRSISIRSQSLTRLCFTVSRSPRIALQIITIEMTGVCLARWGLKGWELPPIWNHLGRY